MVTLRRTWHVHFDTDAEELLAGVQVGMVAGCSFTRVPLPAHVWVR
jgi:hypothetical protein